MYDSIRIPIWTTIMIVYDTVDHLTSQWIRSVAWLYMELVNEVLETWQWNTWFLMSYPLFHMFYCEGTWTILDLSYKDLGMKHVNVCILIVAEQINPTSPSRNYLHYAQLKPSNSYFKHSEMKTRDNCVYSRIEHIFAIKLGTHGQWEITYIRCIRSHLRTSDQEIMWPKDYRVLCELSDDCP